MVYCCDLVNQKDLNWMEQQLVNLTDAVMTQQLVETEMSVNLFCLAFPLLVALIYLFLVDSCVVFDYNDLNWPEAAVN